MNDIRAASSSVCNGLQRANIEAPRLTERIAEILTDSPEDRFENVYCDRRVGNFVQSCFLSWLTEAHEDASQSLSNCRNVYFQAPARNALFANAYDGFCAHELSFELIKKFCGVFGESAVALDRVRDFAADDDEMLKTELQQIAKSIDDAHDRKEIEELFHKMKAELEKADQSSIAEGGESHNERDYHDENGAITAQQLKDRYAIGRGHLKQWRESCPNLDGDPWRAIQVDGQWIYHFADLQRYLENRDKKNGE